MSHSLQEIEKRRGLYRTDDQTIRIRRDRLDRPHLEMRRCDATNVPLRGSQCPAHPCRKVVSAQSWAMRIAKRTGLRKAKVAVARQLAVILHRMWIEGTEFKWSSKEAANQPA
jgi:hypothetical protein